MKKTTTLYEILQSEWIKQGKNEFLNNNQLTFFDNDFSFIRKMMKYDDDVHTFVTQSIFLDFSFNNETIDKQFKRTFFTKFYNRQIMTQTYEDFCMRVQYCLLTHEDYIFKLYKDLEKFQENHTQNEGQNTTQENGTSDNVTNSTTNSQSESTNASESANQTVDTTLPQTQVGINLNQYDVEYGDSKNTNKNKQDSNGTNLSNSHSQSSNNAINKRDSEAQNKGNSQTFNYQYYVQTFDSIEKIFREFDKQCFLQTW